MTRKNIIARMVSSNNKIVSSRFFEQSQFEQFTMSHFYQISWYLNYQIYWTVTKNNYIRQSQSLVNSTYFLWQFCDQNKEFASSFIYFHKLTISQSKISVQPITKTIGDFINDFGGWKMKRILVILYRNCG